MEVSGPKAIHVNALSSKDCSVNVIRPYYCGGTGKDMYEPLLKHAQTEAAPKATFLTPVTRNSIWLSSILNGWLHTVQNVREITRTYVE